MKEVERRNFTKNSIGINGSAENLHHSKITLGKRLPAIVHPHAPQIIFQRSYDTAMAHYHHITVIVLFQYPPQLLHRSILHIIEIFGTVSCLESEDVLPPPGVLLRVLFPYLAEPACRPRGPRDISRSLRLSSSLIGSCLSDRNCRLNISADWTALVRSLV